MPELKPLTKDLRIKLRCETRWPRKKHEPPCSPDRQKRPSLVNRDALQDLEISGLKKELAELHGLLSMLLVLVDPEDVQAALQLKSETPTESQWKSIASDGQLPDGLRLPEEKPW
jgi:hypothetical protein